MIKIIINAEKSTPPSCTSFELAPSGYSPWLQLMLSLGFSEAHPPIADFLRQAYGLTGRWILCEPVYWEAGHNDAMLVADARMLAFSEKMAYPLFTAVAEFLAEEGFTLHYHTAHMWLIRVDDKPILQSLPTHMMLNRSLMTIIKELDISSYWQRLMTELQMFLKSYARGALPVNGFWFYGYDDFSFPAKPAIFSNDALLLRAFESHIKVMSFENEKKWDKKAVLFINPYQDHLEAQVQAKIGKNKAIWNWNNITYTAPATHWWNRLIHYSPN